MKCRNILIVEDDGAIRETLRLILELEGYSVFEASNGKEGIEILPTLETPCLILLDLMMPVMNGWEFAETIQQNMTLATIPVVVVTAYHNAATQIRSKGVLKKPVDFDQLLKIVQQCCN